MNTIDQYLELLQEIKCRTHVITSLDISGNYPFHNVNVELACLQIRRILELIAFASLTSNVELYSKEYEKFAKFWNAERMLRDMETVHPLFYPMPVYQSPTEYGTELVALDEELFLTKKDFVKVYKKCGAVMHSDNPYGSKVDYGYYKENIVLWMNKIRNLLNAHKIKLVGSEDLYLIQMGSMKEKPSCNIFKVISPPTA
ncbi:hypothetical protein SPN99_004270 [Vibrio fluvialis]|nr:hypothetical protein [Vibrio fluvialis]